MKAIDRFLRHFRQGKPDLGRHGRCFGPSFGLARDEGTDLIDSCVRKNGEPAGVRTCALARRRAWSTGFTLIELMIVVAIIGILSVLGVYGVRKYIANAKTAEARNAIGRIANAAVSEFENEKMAATVLTPGMSSALSRALCKSSSVKVPSSIAAVAGRKYQSTSADWSADSAGNSGFTCLHFTIDAPQYYMYSYNSAGTGSAGDTFTALANGDLNADGVQSTFQLVGSVSDSMVVILAPNISVVDEDE